MVVAIELLALEATIPPLGLDLVGLTLRLGAAGARAVGGGALLFFSALGFLAKLIQIDHITHDENAFRLPRRSA